MKRFILLMLSALVLSACHLEDDDDYYNYGYYSAPSARVERPHHRHYRSYDGPVYYRNSSHYHGHSGSQVVVERPAHYHGHTANTGGSGVVVERNPVPVPTPDAAVEDHTHGHPAATAAGGGEIYNQASNVHGHG